MRTFVSALALAAFTLPASAQTLPGTPAEPGTPEALVGDALLYFVDGRTREEAGGDDFNPFGIDPDAVLFHVGAFFIVTDFADGELKEGELAVYPQFIMPRGEGTPSAATPAIMPFAMLKKGECHAGYVAGYPAPNATYKVDLSGLPCHADSVEQMVRDAYDLAQPADDIFPEETAPAIMTAPGFDPVFPTDAQLQSAVYAAYEAAYSLAVATADYTFWDGSDYSPTREAVTQALANENLGGIAIPVDPAADPAAAKACAATGQTELRIAFTPDRTGITVAAVSDSRVYGYEYDYNISPDLRIVDPRPCATSGPGRAGSRSH
ncbi:MAG TPA: hypothetical protein VIN06_02805 [Devosia sp.]